jgi:hypothetical protein
MRPARESTERSVSPAEGYDLRAIVTYAALSLLILLALLAVMRSLGRQPLLVASADLRLGAGWMAVTDSELSYTLSLPPGWQWLDGTFRQQQELLDELALSAPDMRWSLAPLGEVTGDMELVAVAYQPEPPEIGGPLIFATIGRSQRLGEITPQQALDVLAGQSLSSFPITTSDLVENIPGQPQVRFGVLDHSRQVQCRSLFIADAFAGYLVAACAPQASFGRVQRDLDDILDSFQLIER